jgi:hypothetical protein
LKELQAKGIYPSDYLVDGGYTKNYDLEWGYANGVRLWCPPALNKHGTDPYAPREDDGPGAADWRRRMPSEAGQAIYRERGKIECANAWARRMGLDRLSVRGKEKARRDCQDFRVWAGIMGEKESNNVPTQGAGDRG